MSFSCGIVGLPNVGKSTIFNAMTASAVPAENYPFCTIDPNKGIVTVPDPRLDKLTEMYKPQKTAPTTIEFYDIAGLVKGASQGEGLGNQFLSHIREVDAICEVVRAFPDPNVLHVDGSINPQRDQETIHLELAMADLATVAKRIESVQGAARAGKKTEGELLALYEKIRAALDKGAWANTVRLSDDERRMLKDLHLHTLKPLLLALNTTEGQHAPSLAARTAIMMDVKKEADMAELSEDDLKELGLKRTALDELIRAAYETLGLLTFFTSGPKETRAWTVTQGAKAPQAAGVIHSDFERGFIAAEVIHWNDLVTLGGETRAKEVGKMRLEGKEYVVQDGDVVHFRFSV